MNVDKCSRRSLGSIPSRYAPQIASSSLEPAASNGVLMTFATASGQALQGMQQVGQLGFLAASNRSEIIAVNLSDITALQLDGGAVPRVIGIPGRVVVVGDQPLLEALISTNGQPALVLYGQVGTTNVLETTTRLGDPDSWSSDRTLTMTNVFQLIDPVCTNRCTLFFRAKRQ